MVFRNRRPAHFKYPKANQPEMTFLVSGMANLIQDFIDVLIIKMHVFGSEENFKQFIALILKLLMKNIGNLFFGVCHFALNIPLFFHNFIPFRSRSRRFFTAPAPAPTPSKPFWRLRLRLRLRPKCVGSGGSGSGSGSGSASLVLSQYLTQLWLVKRQILETQWFFKVTSPYQQNYLSYRHKTFTSVFIVQFCTEWGVLMHLGSIFKAFSAHRWCRVTPMTS